MGSGFRGAALVAGQRKLGLFHAVRIADARQGLAASLVIFWASSRVLQGARREDWPRGQSRAYSVSKGDEEGEREYFGGTGTRLAPIRGLTKSQLTSLCFLFSDH